LATGPNRFFISPLLTLSQEGNRHEKKNHPALKKIPKLESLKQINLNAAGINIGDTEIWACVPEDRDKKSTACCVRLFARPASSSSCAIWFVIATISCTIAFHTFCTCRKIST